MSELEIRVLKEIALSGGLKEPVKISCQNMAEKLRTSPQTAARRLQDLEQSGMITRVLTGDGQLVMITEKGKHVLMKEYFEYKKIFEAEKRESVILKGRLISGLGEGKYYVTREGYVKQFKEKLGFVPFPGTLNIKLDIEYLQLRGRLDEKQGIKINGFETKNRTFGECKCFLCRVDGKDGAVIIPSRTHYPSEILEIISPYNLREELNLADGDEVRVEVFL